MRKLDVTPEEMKAVCGRMAACRAADHLGITLNRFYYLAQRYGLKTAFVKKQWSDEEEKQLIQMVNSGMKQKEIANELSRTWISVGAHIRRLRSKQD
jgi:hypothetical protein